MAASTFADQASEPLYDKFDIYQTVPSSRPWKELKDILEKEKTRNSPKKKDNRQQPKETQIMLHKIFADTKMKLEIFGTFTEFHPPSKNTKRFKIEPAMEPYFIDRSVPKVETKKPNTPEKQAVPAPTNQGTQPAKPVPQQAHYSSGMYRVVYAPVYVNRMSGPWQRPVSPAGLPVQGQNRK